MERIQYLKKGGVKGLLALSDGGFEGVLDFLAVSSALRVLVALQLLANADVVSAWPLLEPESTGANAELDSTETLMRNHALSLEPLTRIA